MTEVIVGIDLGTTNSEIAVWRDGAPEVLTDEDGEAILPSVVGLSPDGELLVGHTARNQYLAHPDRTVRSIKRSMGQDITVALGDQSYRPQEISAMILRRLKVMAEARLGQPVNKAVITVPAYFSDTQRQATREAGEIAGLEVVRVINEPTAAALVYEAGHAEGKRILVYDLGGGTFDVSVVRIEEGVVEVISSHGNNRLGGDDFDQKLVEHVLAHLRETHDLDIGNNLQAMARITRAAETIKKRLSDQPYATLEEEYLAEKDGTPVHLSLEISRDTYETMIEPFIEETLDAVHIALKGADLTTLDIEEVILVGGATKTPLVRRRLEAVFARQPRGEVDPDLCVAMGAGLQGAAIAGTPVSAVLVDVTPYTFGTSVLGELDGDIYRYCFAPVIPKNTPIPVRKSEVFFTVADNQDSVDCRVFQGENADALKNIELGRFRIEGLSQVTAGNPVEFELALDRNGILQVAAREKLTGLERRITIDNAIHRYEAADIQSARGRIDALFGLEEQAATETGADDDSETAKLLAKARTKLETIADEDKGELVDLIEAVEDARAADDSSKLAEAQAQLTDLLFYLET